MSNEDWYDEHPAWPGGERPKESFWSSLGMALLLLVVIFGVFALIVGACQNGSRSETIEVQTNIPMPVEAQP